LRGTATNGDGGAGELVGTRTRSPFTDWEAYVTIDPHGNGTHREAMAAREGDARIHVRMNRRRQYSMVNVIEGIRRSGAEDDDIITVLDGGDWLATPDALQIIHETYRSSNCWTTYGSWVMDIPVPNLPGRWPAYPEDVIDFRNHEWLGMAVQTWKRWLWDLVDDRDFRGEDGQYFRVTEDQTSMLPMLR
jgi:hypothetical protein